MACAEAIPKTNSSFPPHEQPKYRHFLSSKNGPKTTLRVFFQKMGKMGKVGENRHATAMAQHSRDHWNLLKMETWPLRIQQKV
jgi:hypothetical protein